MKTSEAFRRTKEHLWDGHWEYRAEKGMTKFICIAAIRAMPHPNHAPQVHRLELIIKKLLGGEYTLDTWLRGKGHLPNGPYDERRMQITKHAWLDHLIEHYESIGD